MRAFATTGVKDIETSFSPRKSAFQGRLDSLQQGSKAASAVDSQPRLKQAAVIFARLGAARQQMEVPLAGKVKAVSLAADQTIGLAPGKCLAADRAAQQLNVTLQGSPRHLHFPHRCSLQISFSLATILHHVWRLLQSLLILWAGDEGCLPKVSSEAVLPPVDVW
jgi:hypothetical protein